MLNRTPIYITSENLCKIYHDYLELNEPVPSYSTLIPSKKIESFLGLDFSLLFNLSNTPLLVILLALAAATGIYFGCYADNTDINESGDIEDDIDPNLLPPETEATHGGPNPLPDQNINDNRLQAIQYAEPIPSDYICNVTGLIMMNPVLLVTDDFSPAHALERVAAQQLMETTKECPFTRKKIIGFVENLTLKNLIEDWIASKEAAHKVKIETREGLKSSQRLFGRDLHSNPTEHSTLRRRHSYSY